MHHSKAVALAAAIVLAMTVPAMATHESEHVEHLEGQDTVARAIAWSEYTSPDWRKRPDVLLGRSDGFADSLASATLQNVLEAPLLLTPTSVLDPRVAVELQRLGAETVHILGGDSAISPAVEEALVAQGYETKRYRGTSRVETALDIARLGIDWGPPSETPREVVLARAFGTGSSGFADALGAGPLAAQWGNPLLLTPTERLDAGVAGYLTENDVDRVYLAGGTAALSATVEAQLRELDIEPVRLSGSDRAATALAVLEDRRIEDGDPVILTEGYADDSWAAGLSATLAAVMPFEQECPEPDPDDPPVVGCNTLGPNWKALVLSQGDTLPAATRTYLEGQPQGTKLICAPGVSEVACDLAAQLIAT